MDSSGRVDVFAVAVRLGQREAACVAVAGREREAVAMGSRVTA